MPSSATSRTALPSSCAIWSLMRPPLGVYLIALSSRLTTTCLSLARSPSISTGAEESQVTVMCLSSASRLIWSAVVATNAARSNRTHSACASPVSNRDKANRPSTISASRSTSSRALPRVSRVWDFSWLSCARFSNSPRRTANGVRSSCEASATNCFELLMASSRRLIMRFSDTDRRSSSSPVRTTGNRSLRLCWVIAAAFCERLSTGFNARRTRMNPPATATHTATGRPMASMSNT